jgi:prepilin-type N-terminal cleavage/methylation domain-containing protein
VKRRAGFTLIELVVVVAIMAAVLGLAAPKLLPVLMYSTHEGAARRLANYGTAAIAEAALQRETLVFKFDFDAQQYWVEKLPEPLDEEELEQKREDAEDARLPEDDEELERMARDEMGKELPQSGKRSEAGSKVLDEQAKRMMEKSRKRDRKLLGARADRVKQDDEVLPDSQREDNQRSDDSGDEEKPKESRSLLLSRMTLPEEVQLVLVDIGGEEIKKGMVELEITPAGLDVEVKFYLMNTEGRTFVVTWDPATGSTGFKEDGA